MSKNQSSDVKGGSTRRASVAGAPKCSRAKSSITDQVKQEMADTFSLIDKGNRGYIEASSLIAAVAAFGFELSGAAFDRSKGEQMGLNEFMSFMLSHASSQDRWCRREMNDLFRCIDREDAGYITDTQLRRILGRFGEKLSAAETEFELGQYFIRSNHHIEFDSFMMILSETE